MNIKESGRLNLQVVLNNGFEAVTKETFPQKMLLVFTELDEAMQATDATNFLEELADAAIRITGILCSLWEDAWSDRGLNPRAAATEFLLISQPLAVQMLEVHTSCTKAVECWRDNRWEDVRTALEIALRDLQTLAFCHGAELVHAMEAKRAVNAARPRLHGRARTDG